MAQIKTKFIENSAITTAKIANDAVDKDKIAANVAGSGLGQNGDGSLEVNVDNSTIEINTDAIRVKDAGITEAKLSASVAGAGLTGGAGSALAVGAGSGISVAADSVAVDSTVIRTSGVNPFAADQSMGGFKLTNLADPVSAQDAATKFYVDAVASGLDVKKSVRAATTANITLSGAQTIDGVSAIAGDRILVKDQSTASENGIYVVAAGAWSRSADADSDAEVTAGLFTFIEEGTVSSDSGWVLITNNPIVLNTTALSFSQFSGAGSIVAGAGLVKTGNTIDVVAADTSLTVNANDIAVNLNASGGLSTSSGVKINLEASNPSLQISSNELGIKFDPAGALSKGAAGTKANVDATTVKINGSNNLEALKKRDDLLTLNGTDITNQYKDLSFAAHSSESIGLNVLGGPMQERGVDYTVSLTGGAGGVTRITFAGDLATAGNAELISGDKLMVSYAYLT